MQKLPIAQAAEFLGISKEAVYNRIRRGSLKSTEKDGVKFVILNDENGSEAKAKPEKKPKIQRTKSNNDNEFVKFLLNELDELKEQNQNLQADKERLFKEKEQMLIESKREISAIYKERDEKLMMFLNAMQAPLIARSEPQTQTKIDEHVVDAQFDENEKFISISEYLSTLELDKKAQKRAEKKIIKNINKSKYIKFKNGVILIKKDKKLKQIIGEA